MAARPYTKPGYYDNGAFLCTTEWILTGGNTFPFDEEGLVETDFPDPPFVARVELNRWERIQAALQVLRTGIIQIEVE